MAKINQQSSILPCIGMVGGVLLLSFAGILVVMTPMSYVTELGEQGAAIAAERTQHFLQASPRRLNWFSDIKYAPMNASVLYGPPMPTAKAKALADITTPMPTIIPMTTTVTVTTRTYTTHLSSLDSSDGNSLSGSSSESMKSSESQSSLAMPLEQEHALAVVLPYQTSMIVEVLVMLCFAICYHQCAVRPIIDEFGTLHNRRNVDTDPLYGDEDDEYRKGSKDFENGKFGCLGDIWVTVHGCICPLPRMGHTNEVAEVCGYWETIICFSCCAMLTCGLGPFCLVTYWRKRVKEAMGIDHFGCSDCLISFFCMQFSVCQQSTAVDRKMGYVVSGCCDVTPTGF